MGANYLFQEQLLESIKCLYRLIGLVGRVYANGLGDLGFNPRSRHTKDIKYGTWYLLHSAI